MGDEMTDSHQGVPVRVRVVLGAHLRESDLLGYESALAAKGLLHRTGRDREYVIEILRQSRLDQFCHAVPYWQRSGAVVEWEILVNGE